MSDLENRIRNALADPRRELPMWHDPMRRIRRAARRQWIRLAAVISVIACVVAVAVLAVVITLPVSPASHLKPAAAASCQFAATSVSRASSRSSAAHMVRSLKRPGALAVSPQGRLYVADNGLDQILETLPHGGFRVVAGNGKPGFSGDGASAVTASLRGPEGMAISRTGTLYFADTGNQRIRAVAPNGLISTVVGNGKYGAWLPGGVQARKASLGGPTDVALAPDGCLYIADQPTNEIVKTTPAGTVTRVAGTRTAAGIAGIGLRASSASPDGPNGLAFNSLGNLYIAGSNTKTLLMITKSGIMKLPAGPDGFYPHGPSGLARAPDGNVVAMNGQLIERIVGHQLQPIFNLSGRSIGHIRAFLPNGIAVAANGTIYLDTDQGNGYANRSALLEIQPNGRVRIIWQS